MVLSTAHARKDNLIRLGLAQSPWPGLPLCEKGTHLGIVIGRDVTLADIWETPVNRAVARIRNSRAFVKTLTLANRILYVNVFIISIFSYVGLYFVLPHKIYVDIKNAIAKCIIPFNGGAYTYETLICANLVYGLKPALKDIWCFTTSLLAVRPRLLPPKQTTWSSPTLISSVQS